MSSTLYEDLKAQLGPWGGDFDYELLDTGIFDEDRYFDVAVEVAQARAPRDLLIEITAHNRGPDAGPVALSLPTPVVPALWVLGRRARCVPSIHRESGSELAQTTRSWRPRRLYCDA
ncbi:hypothetical protein ACRAWF_20055 [Streptomyces sp. L7]